MSVITSYIGHFCKVFKHKGQSISNGEHFFFFLITRNNRIIKCHQQFQKKKNYDYYCWPAAHATVAQWSPQRLILLTCPINLISLFIMFLIRRSFVSTSTRSLASLCVNTPQSLSSLSTYVSVAAASYFLFVFSDCPRLTSVHASYRSCSKCTHNNKIPSRLTTYITLPRTDRFAGTNVAMHKPTNQSTTARGGSPSNANDGDPTTVHDGRRCTETLKEPSPWWSVDLLQPYPVRAVSITTRGCCGKSLCSVVINDSFASSAPQVYRRRFLDKKTTPILSKRKNK